MLSVFPILYLSLLAYTILRLCVGFLLCYLGYLHLKKERRGLALTVKTHWPTLGGFFVWYLGIIEFALGALIIVGFWTQPAALFSAILALKMIVFQKHSAHPSVPPRIFWVLFLAASISLTITGAGAFAIDLPL